MNYYDFAKSNYIMFSLGEAQAEFNSPTYTRTRKGKTEIVRKGKRKNSKLKVVAGTVGGAALGNVAGVIPQAGIFLAEQARLKRNLKKYGLENFARLSKESQEQFAKKYSGGVTRLAMAATKGSGKANLLLNVVPTAGAIGGGYLAYKKLTKKRRK